MLLNSPLRCAVLEDDGRKSPGTLTSNSVSVNPLGWEANFSNYGDRGLYPGD